MNPATALLPLAALTVACSFHREPVPVPRSFYALETAVDDAPRAEGWLGMEVALNESGDLTTLELQPGVRVTAVEPSGPAAAAGLRVGDVLLRYGEVEITDPQRLATLLAGEREPRSVTLRFQRGSAVQETEAALEMRTTSEARTLYHVDRAYLRAAFRDGPRGLPVVEKLGPESPLAAAGVVPGDVILAYDGRDPGSAEELVRRLRRSLDPGAPARLRVREAGGGERELRVRAWDPGTVLTQVSIWPLFGWERAPTEARGSLWIGDLLLVDLFRYERDGKERRYSILGLIRWKRGQLVLEEEEPGASP